MKMIRNKNITVIVTEAQLKLLIEAEQAKAAGVYPIVKSTGKICLQKRSKYITNPLTWSNWGGGAEDGESPRDNAMREFREESGYKGKIELEKSYVFSSSEVEYSNYIGYVDKEFEPPMVNKKTVDGEIEVSDYRWVTIDEFKSMKGSLHPAMNKDFTKIVSVLEKAIEKYSSID